jgi:formylglycine-generating enzyme required for sulfatase activity
MKSLFPLIICAITTYLLTSCTPIVVDDLVFVEGGMLPDASELAGKSVKSFYIGPTEVTWLEWKKVRNWASDHGYDIGNEGAGSGNEHPVQMVSWYDCVKWCNARSEMAGLKPVYKIKGAVYRSGNYNWDGSGVVTQIVGANGYRLPSEAEWEWAARGGVKSRGYKYSGSNDLNAVGWFRENSQDSTKAIKTKDGNELGLFDMSGNVWEWCWDLDSSYRHFRGGSWDSGNEYCAVVYREHTRSDNRLNDIGLRLTRSFSP